MSVYLLTANPSRWPAGSSDPQFVIDQARQFEAGEQLVSSEWATNTKHGLVAGERVYLLVQGDGWRGIIASGHLASGETKEGPHWRGDGSIATYVEVDWDAFVPVDDALPTPELAAVAPNTAWQPNSSGTRVKPVDEEAVETAWQAHLDSLDSLGSTGGGKNRGAPPGDGEIERSYREAKRLVRRHQRRFRQLLLKHYPAECAYCGLGVLQVLDAAHLPSDAEGGAASAKNGRLLCANHHRAFDAGLLRWTGDEFEQVEGAATVLPTPPP